jgi:lysophospholipase L1-like esterase
VDGKRKPHVDAASFCLRQRTDCDGMKPGNSGGMVMLGIKKQLEPDATKTRADSLETRGTHSKSFLHNIHYTAIFLKGHSVDVMVKQFNYVSLGDSIATGTLTPFSRTYSYVAYLLKKLREKGYRPNVCNLASDGDTSRDLLWKINNPYRLRKAIENADFITISIGGNDLLKASSIPGFTSINVHRANHILTNFLDNWPKIIEKIRSLNKEAKIVALNLYNPYNDSKYLGRRYYHDRNLCE